jgi:hypothetical protein
MGATLVANRKVGRFLIPDWSSDAELRRDRHEVHEIATGLDEHAQHRKVWHLSTLAPLAASHTPTSLQQPRRSIDAGDLIVALVKETSKTARLSDRMARMEATLEIVLSQLSTANLRTAKAERLLAEFGQQIDDRLLANRLDPVRAEEIITAARLVTLRFFGGEVAMSIELRDVSAEVHADFSQILRVTVATSGLSDNDFETLAFETEAAIVATLSSGEFDILLVEVVAGE